MIVNCNRAARAMGPARPLVKACLFDMDGLLLDTEALYTKVQEQILQRYDKAFTWDLKAKMMGKKALEAAEASHHRSQRPSRLDGCPGQWQSLPFPPPTPQVLVDELGLQGQLRPADFVREREELLAGLFPDAQLMAGAEALVRHLHRHGVPMAVATSSHRRHFDLKTAKHRDLFALFDAIVTGDMVTRGKPDPEIFLEAAARLTARGVQDPSSALVFEDAPAGVEAALRAGMPCVLIPDPSMRLDVSGVTLESAACFGRRTCTPCADRSSTRRTCHRQHRRSRRLRNSSRRNGACPRSHHHDGIANRCGLTEAPSQGAR